MKLPTVDDLLWTIAEIEEIAASIEDACDGEMSEDERCEKIANLALQARKFAKLVLDHCEVQS